MHSTTQFAHATSDDRFPLHCFVEVDVDADPGSLFALLDDHRRLAAHMEKPSLMMAGATMQVAMDARQGQAVGSLIRVSGRVLGMSLRVEEVVTVRLPPWRKTWETRGETRLLVIGSYRMGFAISPRDEHSRLRVFIDYGLPTGRFTHALGLLFGKFYAAWCVQRMAADAKGAQ